MTGKSRSLCGKEIIHLTDREGDAFLDAILNPPPPNKALKYAMSHYQKLNRKPRSRKK